MWKKLSKQEINEAVFSALRQNRHYKHEHVLGIPVSHLDDKVFYDNFEMLKDAPFLSTMVDNPNHIGCHTLGESEAFFAGTQAIERELVAMCAEDIFKGDEGEFDGYVSSGGTETNIQAVWIFRNLFNREFGAKNEEIAVICSDDTHYSGAKSANLLNVNYITVPVDQETRKIDVKILHQTVAEAKARGIKYFAGIVNMMTTMFGSVDNPQDYIDAFQANDVKFHLHVDAAFGGFMYPFSNNNNPVNFQNPYITSIGMDAHKMAQAPFGTGIFLIRKDYMQYALTEEAQYVSGMDMTLVGSRSGANAISVWMILKTYGYYGWTEKINMLLYRTNWLCKKLDQLGVEYYRDEHSNLVTMKSKFIPTELAQKYALVPESHTKENKWYKIVVMDHVSIDALNLFLEELEQSLAQTDEGVLV
ncbi:pyridoxal-dependent decarboxylase [Sediminitomix flava]|uniref:L-histidine carboxy-lyase (Histamine-forming) n=1 Tax=Sediminitomix flava TaxID=379075 RepID=A0A315ZEV0_SEDFL|nr:pyridoxal-dependent decarboxylase [Sediminitomix flava]PWJ43693.1 L-histidine carboxy-lyase (histamine-forming) [Sediminitomix flava]